MRVLSMFSVSTLTPTSRRRPTRGRRRRRRCRPPWPGFDCGRVAAPRSPTCRRGRAAAARRGTAAARTAGSSSSRGSPARTAARPVWPAEMERWRIRQRLAMAGNGKKQLPITANPSSKCSDFSLQKPFLSHFV
jgi:hypothetical protein